MVHCDDDRNPLGGPLDMPCYVSELKGAASRECRAGRKRLRPRRTEGRFDGPIGPGGGGGGNRGTRRARESQGELRGSQRCTVLMRAVVGGGAMPMLRTVWTGILVLVLAGRPLCVCGGGRRVLVVDGPITKNAENRLRGGGGDQHR